MIMETWLAPILVAAVTGLFSYLGVSKTVKAAHDKTILEIKSGQNELKMNTQHQIDTIKADIQRLEIKQDKHNAVIERTFKLEQKVDDMEKRIK